MNNNNLINNNISIISNTDESKTNEKNENTNSFINDKEEIKNSLFNFYYPIKNKNLVWKSKIKHNHSLHIDLTGLSTSQITDSEFKREMENRLKQKEIDEKIKIFKLNGGMYKNAFKNNQQNKHKLSLLNDYSSNTNNITKSIIENNDNNKNDYDNINFNKKNDEKLLKLKIKKHKNILNIPPIKIKKKPNGKTISMDLTIPKTAKILENEKKKNNNNNLNKTVFNKKNKNNKNKDEFDNKCQCCLIF